MAIHVGILDKDPVRLVTALLHRTIYAEKMVFIGVDNQREQYEQLRQVLVRKRIASEFFLIPRNIDISAIKSRIFMLAEQLHKTNQNIYFNASCGLRHRILATYEIFLIHQWQIYVVEPTSDELFWVYPNKNKIQLIEQHIGIEDILTIFGARGEIQEDRFCHELKTAITTIGKKWASNAHELGQGLATLNYLATACRKSQRLDVELSEKQQGYRELKSLIDDLGSVGLAQYESGNLIFSSETARRFANGEWLEWYVHYIAQDIQRELPTIQDLAIGVHVYRKIGNKEVRNELDVVAVANNRMHIIECKTKGMSSDGDDTLYKLESIRDLLGGFQARAMLVSFRPLRHYDVTRATDLGLALIGPDQLTDLRHHLHQWFSDAVVGKT